MAAILAPDDELRRRASSSGRVGFHKKTKGHRAGARAASAMTPCWLPDGPALCLEPRAQRAKLTSALQTLTIGKEIGYVAPSQAGPGNDINAGSRGSQKAPT
jgi:hypothetical protein